MKCSVNSHIDNTQYSCEVRNMFWTLNRFNKIWMIWFLYHNKLKPI